MKAVFDTSVLLGPMPDEVAGPVAISAASLAELHFGVLVARTDAIRATRLSRLAVIEHVFDALPIDASVARCYGQVASLVAHAGRQRRSRVMDQLIAATALAHGASLYTRNAADLKGLEDVLDIVDLAAPTES